MATTPNFNWSTPDNTGLVKNGALDIRTLGNSIDASLVDLKGGTTGQVLAKASATDMDFTWSSPSTAAGYADNCVLNSAMQIWQRGTSSTGLTTAKTFLADRWFSNTGGGTTTYAYTRSTDVPTGFQYSIKTQRTASNTGTTAIYLQQDIETINSIPYAGKTVTFSFYAKAGANYSASASGLNVSLISGTGTDQTQYFAAYTGQATVAGATSTLTTLWQRFTYTGSVGSSAKQLGIQFNYAPTGTAGADDSFFITGVQVEAASSATTFHTNQPTIQAEIAACQRYFEKSYDQDTAPGTATASGRIEGTGNSAASTTAYVTANIRYKVSKRTAPTLTFYDMVGASGSVARTTIAVSDVNTNTPSTQVNGTEGVTVMSASGSSANIISCHYTASSEL
jgi:hypothetical protein